MSQRNPRIMIKGGNPPQTRSFSYEEIVKLIRDHISRGNYGNAALLSAQAAEALRDDLAMQLHAADAHVLNDQPELALKYAQRARSTGNDPVPALICLSRIAQRMGSPDRAIRHISEAISLRKDLAELFYERAELFLSVGNLQSAVTDYEQALRVDGKQMKSLYGLSRIKDCPLKPEHISKVQLLIHSSKLDEEQEANAHFALFNWYDNQEEVEKAFQHLTAGNEIISATYGYQPDEHHGNVLGTIEAFPDNAFENCYPGRSDKQIIFIVGMPRTGSTLIEQTLCAHSQVDSVGENHLLISATRQFMHQNTAAGRFPLTICDENIGLLPGIAQSYLEAIESRTSTPVVVDKTLGDYFFIGLLRTIFPQARFIHTTRHPVATIFSCYSLLFAPGAIQYAYNLEHLKSQYTDVALMMEHWKSVLPGRLHTLEYESMVSMQEQTTRELLNFCNLDWDDRCLDRDRSGRTVTTASQLQIRESIYTSSVSKWEQYRSFLGEVLDLAAAYEKKAIPN